MTEAEFVKHTACNSCNSSDANAVYSDSHTYCFSCGTYTYDKELPVINEKNKHFLNTTIKSLGTRGLTEKTCRQFGYGIAEYNGVVVQVAEFKDLSGKIIGQKIRNANKQFSWLGNQKECSLFGRWLWRDSGKMLVVTEGEIDCLSVAQCLPSWPVVSIKNGAQSAKRCIASNIDWLEKFDSVVFLFDQDEAGLKAAVECAEILSVGKAKIGKMPLKDANEMLVAGRIKELVDSVWGAKSYRPDGLVNIEDLLEEINKPITQGLPWFLDSLTKYTFGRRECELYAFGAGTGIGKTDFITQQIAYDVTELNLKVGLFFLEQLPTETSKRIAGKVEGKRFHVPDDTWTMKELTESVEKLSGKIIFYNSFGQTDWTVIKNKIRYMAHAEKIKLFYLDHLTAMADTADEKSSIEQIMKEMSGLANELKIIIHFISHLATPEGKPHEEGGKVSIRHFKGSRSIGFWSYFMFGLERNQQDEDQAMRKITKLRILKDRYTGQATGNVIFLDYDANTTKLFECVNPSTEEVTSCFEEY